MSGKKTNFSWVPPRAVNGWGISRSITTATSPMPITLFRPFSFLDLMFDWPAVPIDLDF
jgi:hypothetical protein